MDGHKAETFVSQPADGDQEKAVETDYSSESPEVTDGTSAKLPAHFRNQEIHIGWRWGIPAFLVGTCAFLLVSDISSGVTAKTVVIDADGEINSDTDILTVSIISSVKELWDVGSYALAIFIAITSVMWPYLKLILSLAAWMLPSLKLQRRERFIEVVDALDKWSFVDIFVLIIIMVAFRSTIDVGSGVSIEVLIIPKWGFYGFVAANMMSLMGTQAILYQHRKVQYHSASAQIAAKEEATSHDEEGEGATEDRLASVASLTRTPATCLVPLFVACIALHIVGCSLIIYEVMNTRGDETEVLPFSVFSIGSAIPATQFEQNSFGIRWIQFMFYLFAVALPPWNTFLFSVLYLYPMAPALREKVFFLSEITFSWSAVEVFVLSVVFSILQIPKFGNGLIDSGCEPCYSVDSAILPQFAVICASTGLNVVLDIFLFFRAHPAVFPKKREIESAERTQDAEGNGMPAEERHVESEDHEEGFLEKNEEAVLPIKLEIESEEESEGLC